MSLLENIRKYLIESEFGETPAWVRKQSIDYLEVYLKRRNVRSYTKRYIQQELLHRKEKEEHKKISEPKQEKLMSLLKGLNPQKSDRFTDTVSISVAGLDMRRKEDDKKIISKLESAEWKTNDKDIDLRAKETTFYKGTEKIKVEIGGAGTIWVSLD